jgi:ribosomal protein L37AE/L43A
VTGEERTRLKQAVNQAVRERIAEEYNRTCPGCGTTFYSTNSHRIWCTHTCGARQLHLRKTGRA